MYVNKSKKSQRCAVPGATSGKANRLLLPLTIVSAIAGVLSLLKR